MRTRVPVLLLVLVAFLLNVGSTGATGSGTRDQDPVFSPDGKTIAFERFGSSGSIMLISADGKHLRTLVANTDASGLVWSPDGSSLAYAVDNSAIWRVDVATGATTQLTDDGQYSDWQPSWSPDGAEIAYDKFERSWSPDGAEIAYDKFERCFRCTGIWVMNADGSQQHEVAADDGLRPRFSPVSSDELALSAAGARVIDLSGKTIVPGGANDTTDYTTWSPRGTYLAFTLSGLGLWIENLTTKRARRISKLIDERPTWSPDGRVIAGYYQRRLALVRAEDGSRFRVLPNSMVAAGVASWAGTTIAYVHSGYCGIDLAREDGTHIRRLTRTC